jgi:predicted DsbA family dithiol-disulfide isomerase
MALTNTAAARIVDAMEGNMVTYNSNPLKNKVVHADIRVQGIEDDVDMQTQGETSVQLVEQPTPSAEDVEEHERAEEMQTWWNAEMRKHMNQPDGYAKVAVLLIKWADELDELETKDEVWARWTLNKDTDG